MSEPIKKPSLESSKRVNWGKVSKMGADIGADIGLGVGTGVAGFVKGMTYSEPAYAPVIDETQTQEYRNAQAAVRAGQGDSPTRSGTLWQSVMKSGPTPNQQMEEAHQRQAQTDEAFRQPGQPSFSEQRKLNDMQRAKGGRP